MSFYERHILPRLLNAAMSAKPITYQRIMLGQLDDGDCYMLEDAAQALAELPLCVDYSAGITVQDIQAGVNAQRRRLRSMGAELKVVIADYLGLIRPTKAYAGQKVNEIGEISLGLKELAKREEVAVIAGRPLTLA